ncbi:hypothetical protein RND81_04G171300 [Saponaria officinalis]|uniref:Uncharacterized protein n=1 Tax=Saponaria officinalis TaxID=3572 RepID=A0AAW1LKA7_SAPOF
MSWMNHESNKSKQRKNEKEKDMVMEELQEKKDALFEREQNLMEMENEFIERRQRTILMREKQLKKLEDSHFKRRLYEVKQREEMLKVKEELFEDEFGSITFTTDNVSEFSKLSKFLEWIQDGGPSA